MLSRVWNMKVSDPCAYSVYAYVFDDGHTYIGLTRGPVKRARNHWNPHSNSAVRRYWNVSDQNSIPDMLVLYSGLSASEAQRTEGLLVDCISQNMRLNIAPTGIGVGGLGGWLERTDEEVREAKRSQRRKAVERTTKWVNAHQEARKACMKEYRRKNHSSLAEKDKKYHIRFRKERLLQMAEYTRTHKDEKREYDRIYRQLHREKRKEQMKAWRERQKSGTTTKSGR